MDKAIAYAKMEDVIVATFGDMLKVPGSRESLSDARGAGADIRVVYSPLDALAAARENPEKTVVFLGVGFETTAPTEAAAVLAAKEEGLANFLVLSAQKLVPPAVRLLLDDRAVHVDGFLLPGHACVVTGTRPYAFLADEARVPGVVAGFTPLAILRAVWRLVRQTAAAEAHIENEYGSVVKEEGNPAALAVLARVYEEAADEWRGLGVIERSGLRMREEFAAFDAERRRLECCSGRGRQVDATVGAGPAVRVSRGSSRGRSEAWESSDSPELYETPETSDDSYVPPSSCRARSRTAASGHRR